jgi:beta-phosphoglucomutase-like phosphatase (HAD superfamily)
MKAIIFDLDGVLVDTMPTHFRAMRIALKELTGIDLNKRTFYLLEGMPIAQMALKLFKLKDYSIGNTSTAKKLLRQHQQLLAERVAYRKKELVLETKIIPKPFGGVAELLMNELGSTSSSRSSIKCLKAVVSGSSKQEVDLIINTYFGSQNFDAIITGDEFEGKGKPNPDPFYASVRKLNDVTPNADVIIVENAPLGVKAANAAKITSIVALNTSPLTIADFKGLINRNRIFKNTASAGEFLKRWIGYNKLKIK